MRSKHRSALDWALDYAARGWSVVPIVPRDKRPLVAWTEFQGRRASSDEVRAWFRSWPDAGVGIVTGAVSGLVVLDIDPRHGGEETLEGLLKQDDGRRSMPATVEAETGGGGRHLYFRHPGGSVRNRVAVGSGLDVRGDGGMIVAPPSIHPSGDPYVWRAGRAPGEADLAPMPPWLSRAVAPGGTSTGHPAGYWRDLVHEGVAEGARNNTVAQLTGHLLFHGVDTDVVTELMLCWNRVRCRPPLDDGEVLRTVASISRLHAREN